MIDLTPLVQTIVVLIAAFLTAYIVPLIKERVETEKLNKILTWVETLVACADQIYERHQGAEKKQYVMERLSAILAEHHLTVDMQSLEDLIESEVLKLHSQLKAMDVIED